MPVKKYTKQDRERALRLYDAGMSGPQVEAVTGIHKASVQKWAREEGIVRARSEVSLSDREKKEILALYKNSLHTIVQISRMTGISEKKIWYFLSKKGKTRSPGKARRVWAMKRKRRRSVNN